jgi:hypothetical protein
MDFVSHGLETRDAWHCQKKILTAVIHCYVLQQTSTSLVILLCPHMLASSILFQLSQKRDFLMKFIDLVSRLEIHAWSIAFFLTAMMLVSQRYT